MFSFCLPCVQPPLSLSVRPRKRAPSVRRISWVTACRQPSLMCSGVPSRFWRLFQPFHTEHCDLSSLKWKCWPSFCCSWWRVTGVFISPSSVRPLIPKNLPTFLINPSFSVKTSSSLLITLFWTNFPSLALLCALPTRKVLIIRGDTGQNSLKTCDGLTRWAIMFFSSHNSRFPIPWKKNQTGLQANSSNLHGSVRFCRAESEKSGAPITLSFA